MDRLKSVVVGVDFSEFSQVALDQAARIARCNQAKLHVIHVIGSAVVDDLQESLGAPTDEFHDEVRAAALQRVEEMVAKTDTEGVDTALKVVIGAPFYEILRCVRDASGDLLALGTRGSSVRSVGPGTVATKCVRKAAAKVLLVRQDHPGPFKNVVACIDFSDHSRQVVEQAVRVSLQDKANLHVIHAFYPPWKRLHYMAPTRQASPDYQGQYKRHLDDRMHGYLEPFSAETSQLTVECHLIESDDAAGAIVDFKADVGADLVVLGARGRTGLKALLLGTTAERVIRESACSVLTVKPEGFQFSLD